MKKTKQVNGPFKFPWVYLDGYTFCVKQIKQKKTYLLIELNLRRPTKTSKKSAYWPKTKIYDYRDRGELTKLMRKNESLEEEVEGRDKKIGLLVQNRISVQVKYIITSFFLDFEKSKFFKAIFFNSE